MNFVEENIKIWYYIRSDMKDFSIHVSMDTILRIVAVVIGVFLLWKVQEVLAIIVVALFLAALMQPVADWAHKYKIPRSLTVILIYVLIFGLLAAIVALMVPTIIDQAVKLGVKFGERWENISQAAKSMSIFAENHDLLPESGFASIQTQATNALGRLFTALSGFFGGVVAFVIVLVMAYYMVAQEDKAKTLVADWVPKKYQKFSLYLIERLQFQMSRWFAGQLLLSLIIGIMYYIGLRIIGVESALVLAVFAGFVEFVPYLGPILGGIPIVFVGFSQSTFTGVLALVLLIVIQQAENHLIVPKVMQRAVGLNPLISITAMLVGARLFGLMGALLAIPLATAVMVIIKEVRIYRNRQDI